MANARDVKLDITATDKTGPATASAGRNIDKLKGKVEGAERAAGRTKNIEKYAEKMKGGALAALGGLALLAKGAIDSASKAEQSIGATQTVFGKYADAIIKKSANERDNVRLTADQYRESANLIGSLFKNQGVAADKLAAKTEAMVQVGADLAATYGGSTKDAVEALGSAFKGEFDPMERYGISLKQSSVNAELARMGADKLTGAAKAQAQQQAITNLIQEQARDALGAAGREAGTTAAKTEAMKEKYGNLSAELGKKLLPIVNRVLDIGIKLTDWASKHQSAVAAAAVAVGILAAGILALNLAMLANPFGLVVVAIAALAAGFTYAWKTSQTFREKVSSAFSVVATFVLQSVRLLLTVMKGLADGIFNVVIAVLRALGKIPGNDWADRAADAVEGYKTKVDSALGGAIQKTKDWETAVNKMPKEIKLKGDIENLKTKIEDAKKKLKDPKLTDPEKAKINADISQLQEQLRKAKEALAGVKSKTITLTVLQKNLIGKTPAQQRELTGRGQQAYSGDHIRPSRSFATSGLFASDLPPGGAQTVNFKPGPTNVYTTVQIDGREIAAVARTIVDDRARRDARRANVGRR